MSNYFELYQAILSTISEHSPETGQQLFNALSSNEYIVKEKNSNPKLVNDTLATLDNLIDDGLVNGTRTPTKSSSIYKISGLSTLGYQYLSGMTEPSTSDKLKKYVKENGLPATPQGLTKLIAQLIF